MSHPIHLIVRDDLRRSRLTVLFRLLLAIPHLVWLTLWTLAATFAALVNWLATLVLGTAPRALHAFLAAYVRYATQVYAYLYLVANPYPPFVPRDGYPVDVEIAPPARQSRWTVAFRLVLALPALLIVAVLELSARQLERGYRPIGLLPTVAVFGWIVSLLRGRMPRGLRDAAAYALSYAAQAGAYLLVLTDRYPNSDPRAALDDLPAIDHPVSLTVEDDLRRSRVTVFFRSLLSIPHLVVLVLWGVLALVAVAASWLATLVRGVTPQALHRFLAAYLRYQTRVTAYLTLTANPFPAFPGRESGPPYPVELHVAERERQNRWTVAFRIVLAVPALILASAYSSLLVAVALLGWFASLALGRMPLGLRNAAALALRYSAQANAYTLLLTDRYPYSGPTAAPTAAEAPAATLPPDAVEAVA